MYVRKEERAQINELVFHVKKLKREEQIKPQAAVRKMIILNTEINKILNKQTKRYRREYQQNQTRFFGKINKSIDLQ